MNILWVVPSLECNISSGASRNWQTHQLGNILWGLDLDLSIFCIQGRTICRSLSAGGLDLSIIKILIWISRRIYLNLLLIFADFQNFILLFFILKIFSGWGNFTAFPSFLCCSSRTHHGNSWERWYLLYNKIPSLELKNLEFFIHSGLMFYFLSCFL